MAAGGRKAAPGEPVTIHCRGCRRTVGVGPADYRIYCDIYCASDFPVTREEQRDALIEALAVEYGEELNQAHLAALFGVSRQLINKILQQRDIRRTQ